MNRILATIITAMCIAAIPSTSQNKAQVEVSYTVKEPDVRTGNTVEHRYILQSGASESKFYSPRTEYVDSLRSTPEGEAKYQEMCSSAFKDGVMRYDAIPRPDGVYYITKNVSQNRIATYDINGLEQYFMEETMPTWDWHIADSTKIVLGYECQLATTDFHGRKWIVWFTPDIPVMDGPWKLCGLPGIILDAADASGMYSFTADGVQLSSRCITPVYSANRYERIGRVEFLKAKRKYTDNPVAHINAQLSGSGVSIISTGNGFRYKSRDEVDFIETDY